MEFCSPCSLRWGNVYLWKQARKSNRIWMVEGTDHCWFGSLHRTACMNQKLKQNRMLLNALCMHCMDASGSWPSSTGALYNKITSKKNVTLTSFHQSQESCVWLLAVSDKRWPRWYVCMWSCIESLEVEAQCNNTETKDGTKLWSCQKC